MGQAKHSDNFRDAETHRKTKKHDAQTVRYGKVWDTQCRCALKIVGCVKIFVSKKIDTKKLTQGDFGKKIASSKLKHQRS